MIDNWTIPGFRGDDKEQEVEKATFEVYQSGNEGYIYYDGALLYDREADENGEDDLFAALVELGKNMNSRGYVDFTEKDGGRDCE